MAFAKKDSQILPDSGACPRGEPRVRPCFRRPPSEIQKFTVSSDEFVDADVTALLVRLSNGGQAVLDDLLPAVYDELRRLAHRKLRGERDDLTLRTTELVHEAYLKLVDHHDVDWQDRQHFFAVAARAMRQVLVEHARRRRADKRGGGAPIQPLDQVTPSTPRPPAAVLAVDQALDRLAELDERQVRVVECRFFGGYTIEETADVLDVSHSTVERDWRTAKAWLRRELQD